MFFVAGVTGQIGGKTAAKLLAEGCAVRSLVRDLSKAKAWAEEGVDLRVGDLTNADELATALRGVEAAFLMQPTPIGVTREFPEARELTHALVEALAQNPPPRVVALSSVGSEQNTGLGNITQTHLLERALEPFNNFPLAIVRPGSLLENNLVSLERARETGVFDSFFQPLDRTFPMTATVDVGAEVARLLVGSWSGRPITEIGSYYTPTQIADAMSQALNQRVEARAIQRASWSAVLKHMGLSDETASNWEELMDGFNTGWIDFGRPGTHAVPGSTSPYEVFAAALARKGTG